MISDVEHLFMYLLDVFPKKASKWPFRSSAHFFNWVASLVFVLYILGINHLLGIWFEKIPPFFMIPFHSVVSFALWKLLSMM